MWWTLQRFREALGEELEVVLVLHESLVQHFHALEEEHGAAGVNQVITGGAERWHSVLHGLNSLPDSGVVGIHDAVRPFVSASTILDCYQTAAASGSAVPVVPVKDSIREVHGAGSHAVTRDRLRAVQTPQCFDIELLKSAYSARGTAKNLQTMPAYLNTRDIPSIWLKGISKTSRSPRPKTC